jgi:hypothetical protein
MNEHLARLKAWLSVEAQHGGTATLTQSVPVRETFANKSPARLIRRLPCRAGHLPEPLHHLRRLLEARMGNRGKREFIQVLRLIEVFPETLVGAAALDAIRLGAISFDAVKQLVIAKIDHRPATAAADALIDHGLLRATYSSDGRERRRNGEKLEQAVNMALDEVMAILGFSLDPDDRTFSSILKANDRLSWALSSTRVDDRRFAAATSAHDIEMEKIISERLEAAKRQIERMR